MRCSEGGTPEEYDSLKNQLLDMYHPLLMSAFVVRKTGYDDDECIVLKRDFSIHVKAEINPDGGKRDMHDELINFCSEDSGLCVTDVEFKRPSQAKNRNR